MHFTLFVVKMLQKKTYSRCHENMANAYITIFCKISNYDRSRNV